ncbi:nucleotide exchange factor GrpE [Myxococcota bacterium]
MSKKQGTDAALEDAMAAALAAVEKAEQQKDVENSDETPIEIESAPDNEDAEEQGEGDGESEKDQFLRLAADFENYRKRASRQMEEARRYGAEKLLSELLPVIDNLERALAHSEGEDNPIVEGIRMVTKQFLDVLARHGVEGFGSLEEVFDPERHEAMGQTPAGDKEAGTIVEEMLKGYFLHERLLRPAQVIVAGAAADASEDDPDLR